MDFGVRGPGKSVSESTQLIVLWSGLASSIGHRTVPSSKTCASIKGQFKQKIATRMTLTKTH